MPLHDPSWGKDYSVLEGTGGRYSNWRSPDLRIFFAELSKEKGVADLTKMQILPPQSGMEFGVSTAFPFLKLSDEAGFRCGVSTLKAGKVEMDLTYDEVLYLIEGQVTMESDGQSYPLAAGDAIWMPANRHIIYHVPVPSRMFYIIPGQR